MEGKIGKFRHTIRSTLDRMDTVWQNFIRKYPAVVYLYMILSWLLVIAFLISLFVFEDSRKMTIQFLWSFYVILQFWLLCRSKTLSWKQYTRFFIAGAWAIVPLTNVAVLLMTKLFGGSTSDFWSMSIVTPIMEEVIKLLPLGMYLFLSRRASSLSLVDYALIGAASGAGFQLMEEFARRIASGNMYGSTLLGGTVLHWDLFTLFPGHFEESFLPTQMSAGHGLLTAMITLAVGFAIRFKSKFTKYLFLFPGICLFIAILDHALWNGSYQFPDWIRAIHDLMGSGYRTKTWFLMMLGMALIIDYADLNRNKEQIPRLPHEKVINPFSEIWNLIIAFFKSRQHYGFLLHFYRERREFNLTLLYGNSEAKETRLPQLTKNVEKYYQIILAIAATLLVIMMYSGWEYVASGYEACFACLFDSLQNWWDGLSGWEKGAIFAGAFALTVPFLGVWSALAAASTGIGLAASGKEIADVIRHPKKLMSPEYAAASVLTIGMSRLPFGKIVSKKILKAGKGIERFELTTASGLTYRTSIGSKGELLSVFAKIEKRHLGKGTQTNSASRKYVRKLGKSTDDAGHAIGNNLGGLGNKYSGNIFPQNLGINRGAFREFEKLIAKEVAANKNVFVRVVPKYAAGSTRPYEIAYHVRIDGVTIKRVFPNP
ncbi:PrsW family glutamic-type intramembrane protease [Lederbergia sp. NSJ-179]|uniref:PrsW family glutamic-type intramembrane protease n=1 Tax=Lederbergia sp. NSJ-179 TaxID=2931402 RepID=UPI001FD1E919|nr:PrsW family glutamic-type intramembrane protease [Lederbergia sp. NSJ-179]MCJ7840096.1 PrsW family glutamic-type intramembrane protease [Lederbergia sp. NSJ-179]